MIRVKICGITRIEDARAAAAAGADAIGFVFHPPSPRCVTPDRAAEIGAAVPPEIARIGVFVDRGRAEIEATSARARLTAVQLHGDEPPSLAHGLSKPVIKAFRGRIDSARIERYRVRCILLDGAAAGAFGGSGVSADDASAALLAGRPDFILSGGLTADNVGARCRRFRPAAVDVASGVEREPGVKDAALIEAFVRAARANLRAARPRRRSRAAGRDGRAC